MKKLLFLGGPIFQIPIIEKAKECGLDVGLVDIDCNAPAVPYVNHYFSCSLRDKNAVLDIAKEFKPDGVICGACDTSVVTAAYVASNLGLPFYSEDVSIKATNKLEMLYSFVKYGVPHPKFQYVKKKELDSFKCDICYPVITKPVDSAGGRGVNLVSNESELSVAAYSSSKAGLTGDILIEEYLSGPEVSVEVVVIDSIPYVLQITDKITSGAPNFYEIGHVQPSALPKMIKKQISDVAVLAVKAIGINNSPAHIEIKVTPNGPKMIELGGRMGGDCITTYLLDNSVKGISMSQIAIKLALGEKPLVHDITDTGTSVAIVFIPSKKGVIKGISGLQDAQNIEGVIKVEVIGKPGHRYDDACDDTGRFAYVIALGKNNEEAVERCKRAINHIHFELV